MQFLNCCRCCLENKGPQNHFPLTTTYDKGTLIELVETITGLKILLTPDLPSHICNLCLAKFLGAEEVKTKFIESEDILRSIVSVKVESIENSSILEVCQDESQDDPISMDREEGGKEIQDTETQLKNEEQEIFKPKVEVYIKEESLEPAKEELEIDKPKHKKKKKKNYKRKPLPDISKQFSCDTCLELIPRKHQYEKHLQKHKENNDPPAHTCQTCSQKFYKTSMFINHKCIVNANCWVCQPPLKFSTKRQVHEHMTEKHLSDDKKFHCNFEECQYSSVRAYSIFYHMSSHFEKLEFLCQHCSSTFNNYEMFRHHIQRHRSMMARKDNPFICDYCGIRMSNKWNCVRHMKAKHLRRKIQCDLCSYAVYNYETMQYHKVNKHNLVTPFRCKTCNKYFPYKSALLLHERNTHLDRRKRLSEARKDNTCPHCEGEVKFSSNWNLKSHIKTIHIKKKDFKCPWEGCSAAFGQKSHQIIHTRKHTGDKPIQCSECPSRFSDPSVHYKHLKNVHNIVQVKRKKKIDA